MRLFGASGMGMDRTGEAGDRANKGQVAGCMEQVLQKGLWQGKETEN